MKGLLRELRYGYCWMRERRVCVSPLDTCTVDARSKSCQCRILVSSRQPKLHTCFPVIHFILHWLGNLPNSPRTHSALQKRDIFDTILYPQFIRCGRSPSCTTSYIEAGIVTRFSPRDVSELRGAGSNSPALAVDPRLVLVPLQRI